MSDAVIQPDWIPEDHLRRLNPIPVEDPKEISRVLENARARNIELRRGTNRYAEPERAWIKQLNSDRVSLSVENFDPSPRSQVFLNLAVDGVEYFFSCEPLRYGKGVLELRVPTVIYRAERRDRRRARGDSAASPQIKISLADGSVVNARQIDAGGDGVGVELERGVSVEPGETVVVDFVRSPSGRGRAYGEVRHASAGTPRGGWRRLGLVLTDARRDLPASQSGFPQRARLKFAEPADLAERASRRVRFKNARGERIEAIVDSVGDQRGGTAVVIPPAWGRTKESTVALAETILQTFARAGESVCVVRFDGIRRRGESSNEADCQPPVGENRYYTFSQGVRDILATLDFLDESTAYAPAAVFLVTFSIASVEGRRAIAESRGRIDGWVSLVGAVDPQSMIRVVSGGVDYFSGALDGLTFGTQYIQGLLLNVDAVTRDAIACRMAFLDDARRDMARISVPITWIYGTNDAWTSPNRVRDMLSVGPSSNRTLIEIPTGHQLRTSRQALDAFELAVVELGKLALGRTVEPVRPSPKLLRERRRAERRGLKQNTDLLTFWTEYLVGRDGRLGIELVSATSAYRSFMALQIEGLGLEPGSRVVDLGSGAGSFPVNLAEHRDLGDLHIVEVDLVREGLRRSRSRVRQLEYSRRSVDFVVADLDSCSTGARVPLVTGAADAVLASLVVNYLSDPKGLLQEAARVLAPGGRLVFSGMRPDADVSKLCVSGAAELRSGRARATWEPGEIDEIDRPLQEFISSGARLLDLEEAGVFRFWEANELLELVERRYFNLVSVQTGYGNPAQAIVVTAERTEERVG